MEHHRPPNSDHSHSPPGMLVSPDDAQRRSHALLPEQNGGSASVSAIHDLQRPLEQSEHTSITSQHLTALHCVTQPSVQRAVRFKTPPPASDSREEEEVNPLLTSRARVNSIAVFFKELRSAFQELETQRQLVQTLRTGHAYQQSMVDYKQDFVRDSFTVPLGILLGRKDSAASQRDAAMPAMTARPAELKELTDQLTNDFDAFQEQRRVALQLRDDLNKQESALQAAEERHYAIAMNMQELLAETENDVSFDVIASPAPGDGIVESVQLQVPAEVEVYQDKLGDYRILSERLADLEIDYNEELSRRDLLEEQERPVDPGSARKTDATYTAEHEELWEAVRKAKEDMETAYRACVDNGYKDPDKYALIAAGDSELQLELEASDQPIVSSDEAAATLAADAAAADDVMALVKPVSPARQPFALLDRAASPQVSVHDEDQLLSAPASVSAQGPERVKQWLSGVEVNITEHHFDRTDEVGSADQVTAVIDEPHAAGGTGFLGGIASEKLAAKLDDIVDERTNEAAEAAVEQVLKDLNTR